MNLLRYDIVDKLPGFSSEMIHIKDNSFVLIGSQYIDIVFEKPALLECYGFSRSAISKNAMGTIIEQPVLKSVNSSLIDIMTETIIRNTIGESSSCKELRSRCKAWRGNHYVSKIYDSRNASLYSFTYSTPDKEPTVLLQAINYGRMDNRGSFSVERDILEAIYNLI